MPYPTLLRLATLFFVRAVDAMALSVTSELSGNTPTIRTSANQTSNFDFYRMEEGNIFSLSIREEGGGVGGAGRGKDSTPDQVPSPPPGQDRGTLPLPSQDRRYPPQPGEQYPFPPPCHPLPPPPTGPGRLCGAGGMPLAFTQEYCPVCIYLGFEKSSTKLENDVPLTYVRHHFQITSTPLWYNSSKCSHSHLNHLDSHHRNHISTYRGCSGCCRI